MTDLPAGSGWFTAALLAMIGTGAQNPSWITDGKNVDGKSDAGEATYVLHNPFKDETKSVKVSSKDVSGGADGSQPW